MFKLMKPMALAALFLASPWLMAEPVDLNAASAAELDKALTGIGPAKAKAIVDYRNQNGPFKTVDDLTHVKGIGKATVEKNRANATVTGAAPAAAPVAVPAPAAAAPPARATAPAAPH